MLELGGEEIRVVRQNFRWLALSLDVSPFVEWPLSSLMNWNTTAGVLTKFPLPLHLIFRELAGALSREILSCIKASPLPKDLASLPEHNSRLSYLLRKAKDLDIPKEKIEVTLQKARSTGNTGEETAIYEVLGSPSSSPTSSSGGGQPIALVIECTTNSTSRTIAKLKESLNKMHNGWRLGNTGHLFDKVGTIWLALKEDEAGENFDKVFEGAVENGAEDVRWLEDEEWEGEESLEEVREKGERVLEVSR